MPNVNCEVEKGLTTIKLKLKDIAIIPGGLGQLVSIGCMGESVELIFKTDICYKEYSCAECGILDFKRPFCSHDIKERIIKEIAVLNQLEEGELLLKVDICEFEGEEEN